MHAPNATRGNSTLRLFWFAQQQPGGCSKRQELRQETDGPKEQRRLSPYRETTSVLCNRNG